MKNLKFMILVVLFAATSCVKDLERLPAYDVTAETLYKDPASYKGLLSKLYAGLALSGQQGPAGKGDIKDIDEGFSTYLRQYWKVQELPTDEAVIGWNDGSLPSYNRIEWTATNEFVTAMYNRIFYQIVLCNEFIRETTDEKLASRGISDPAIKAYRAEARFLRALSYWHALDMFGSVPFVTENDAVGAFLPKQATRAELFTYVESELKAVETELVDSKKNEYGRADKAAAWMLLAKLYLNAEVYVNQNKYTDAVTYANKVIGGGYTIDAKYQNLFLADNNKSNEIIFPIAFDGTKSKTWGGMTFLVHAPVGGTMKASEFGINGGWSGLRTTKQFVSLFNKGNSFDKNDARAMFYTDGQDIEINDIFKFTDGFAITKYKNVSSTGVAGSDVEGNFPDTDFPMFRLADAYLIYAEAVLRGGAGGTAAQALTYVNNLRQRAFGNATNNLTTLTLDDVLNERGRELYWEGHRRTDLIRYKKFTTGAYLWAWKGGVKDGRAVQDFYNLFPIPSSDLIANPNLKQNLGY